MTHWNRDIDTSAATGEGEASPSNPLGWAVGKGDFLYLYLTVTDVFIASQKYQSFAFWQKHITKAVSLILYGIDPWYYRGRSSRARGKSCITDWVRITASKKLIPFFGMA